MKSAPQSQVEIRDVATGLWIWRLEHSHWKPGLGWEPVVASTCVEPGGELRVWATPWHEERVLPALCALLDLPFERVIVSHGEPVHTRAAYERALEIAPWSG